ncbi:MAG: hypothetical protein ACI97K_003392 [Glaciecola sp.]|jgi:hypothetical protein
MKGCVLWSQKGNVSLLLFFYVIYKGLDQLSDSLVISSV